MTQQHNTSSLPLPAHNHIYKDKSYWESRFQQESSYEWLCNYTECLQHLLEQCINKTDRILHIGCGNSQLAHDMYQSGYTNIVNIDFSTEVINRQRAHHASCCPGLQWQVQDILAMTEIADAQFDVVLDKCCLDALVVDEGDPWDPSATVRAQVHSCLSEPIHRIENYYAKKEYGWTVEYKQFGTGLGWYLYTCQKVSLSELDSYYLCRSEEKEEQSRRERTWQEQARKAQVSSDEDEDGGGAMFRIADDL